MEVLELTIDDVDAAAALWAETGLTRPWNDPHADFRRAIEGPTSAMAIEDGSTTCRCARHRRTQVLDQNS